MKSFFRQWYVRRTAAWSLALTSVPAILDVWIPGAQYASTVAVLVWLGVMVAESILVWRIRAIAAHRVMDDRLSLGDDNYIHIDVRIDSPTPLQLTIIDELPIQFQARDVEFALDMREKHAARCSYVVHPTRRGAYDYGSINVYARTFLGLVERRFSFEAARSAKVYASVINMKRQELRAFSQSGKPHGARRIRRLGHTMEFEKIKPYVAGDDRRTINWRATARTGAPMVNLYQAERAQDVYAIIDTGRVMKMPFLGLTLVDHAVNASLAFSNIVLKTNDRAGLIVYDNKSARVVPAEGNIRHLGDINDVLYALDTQFLESDDVHMVRGVRAATHSRALLMLYTNIESMSALKRRLPAFRALSRNHVLVVVIFENTELRSVVNEEAHNLEGVYRTTVAADFALTKRELVAELRRLGIYAILTAPEDLSAATIDVYLEMKARGVI